MTDISFATTEAEKPSFFRLDRIQHILSRESRFIRSGRVEKLWNVIGSVKL